MTSSHDSGAAFSLEITHRAPDDWDTLVARDPDAEFTHLQFWTDTLCDKLPGTQAVWLGLRRSGDLVGGLNAVRRTSTRRVLGRTFDLGRLASSFEGSSGGPVIDGSLDRPEQDGIFLRLVDALASQRQGLFASCAMVLGPAQEKRYAPAMPARAGWIRRDAPTAVVSLAGGIEQVEKSRLARTKRKERNRGLRQGAEVFVTSDVSLLEDYYRIYERAAGHWGIDLVPLALLRALLEDGEGRAFFTCVRLEGKVIGGHLNLHFRDKVLAWNGVTDPCYARTHYPSSLCFWGDLTEACRRGAAWLDLGGSGGLTSLTEFKEYFGAEQQMRGLYVRDSLVMGLVRKGRDNWRRQGKTSAVDRWHDHGAGERS